jgi:hypothetical protein
VSKYDYAVVADQQKGFREKMAGLDDWEPVGPVQIAISDKGTVYLCATLRKEKTNARGY